MSKKRVTKKQKINITTYERLTKDSGRKAKIEKKYRHLLLSELLLAMMEEDCVSIRKLAKAAGISPSIIQSLRSGKKENLTLKSFSNIAAALGYGIVLEKLSEPVHR